MSINGDHFVSLETVFHDDFIGEGCNSRVIRHIDEERLEYARRFIYLAYFTRQFSPVESGLSLLKTEAPMEDLVLSGLLSPIKACRFFKRSPADSALEVVLGRLGLNGGRVSIPTGVDDLQANPRAKAVRDGFMIRLKEALRSSDFCRKQRAWLRESRAMLKKCDAALDKIQAINSPVSCVRLDCYFMKQLAGGTEIKLAQGVTDLLRKCQSELGVVAALLRGERISADTLRLHCVVFFHGEMENRKQALKKAMTKHFYDEEFDCLTPFGYRSKGQGELAPDCNELRYAMRAMLARDEYLRPQCDRDFSFSFQEFDADRNFFPIR